MKTHPPILYSFRRCPWAMRARIALAYVEQTYELREVNLRNKPAAMLEVSPKGTVPVLVLNDGTVIDESYDVMLWAIQQNDPAGWGEVIDHPILHQPLQELLKLIRVFKYQEDSAGWDAARTACETWLADLEMILAKGGFLTGALCRLVDAALFPIIRQVSKVNADWFATLNLKAIEAWLDCFFQADFFQQAMLKFPVWQA
jgi:glutathione S-transferase